MISPSRSQPHSWGVRCAAILFVALLSAAGSASAQLIYDLGDADDFATDQPRVAFGLTDEPAPGSTDPATVIGPQQEGSALADTLASGVLLGVQAYRESDGVSLIDYGQPAFSADYDGNGTIDADEHLAQYNEQGVAGTSLFDVHDLHGLRITDSSGTQFLIGYDPAAQAAGNPDYYTPIRAFGDSSLSLGSFNAIVGMPGMVGYAIEMDMRPLVPPPDNPLGFDFMKTYWHESTATALMESTSSVNVNLRMVPSVHSDTLLPENLRPTFAPLPVIDAITLQHVGGANSTGGIQVTNGVSMGVDTGAQTTIFNQALATSLGIDFTNTVAEGGDVVDFLEVGGVGGTVLMPIVFLDQLLVPTADGNQILFREIAMGVLDIDGAPFDGVFGMNLLSTGYFGEVFLGQTDAHVFDKVVFDFTTVETTDTAVMRLDFYQAATVIDPFLLGDADGDGDVDAFDITAVEQNFGNIGEAYGVLLGDADGDGDVDAFDITAVEQNFGNVRPATVSSNATTVPEPSSLLLITLTGTAILSRRRR